MMRVTVRMPAIFLAGKENSSAECDTLSKPMNAQDDRHAIRMTWPIGLLPGTNRGS